MNHYDDKPAVPELTGLAPSRLLHVPAEDRIIHLDVETVEDSVEQVKTGLTTAAQELAWQLESQVWRVMHFEDWPAFQLAMYGKKFVTPVRKEERSWFVAELLQAGSTQTEAAKALGVSQATINHEFPSCRF
jgi:DNA-binding NarL/FixJ family response regulator